MSRESEVVFSSSTVIWAVVCVAVWVMPAYIAQGGWPVELSRLPDTANAIGLIDVEVVRALGQGTSAEARAFAELLGRLPGAEGKQVQRLLLAAQLELDTLDTQWEIAVATLGRAPGMAELAAAEDGYVDRIGEREVAWSPRNLYFVPLPDDRIVAVRPANRQLLTRWLKQTGEGQFAPLGAYLAEVSQYSTANIPVFLAVDLEGAFAPSQAREKLARRESLGLSAAQLDAWAKLAGELRGCYFAVQQKAGLTAKLQLDFHVPPTALAESGNRLLQEVLTELGIGIEELADWNPHVDENSYSLTGPIKPASLASVLDMLRSPQMISSMSSSVEMMSSSSALSSEQQQAQASKRYFDSVRKLIDDVREYSAQTPGYRASYNDRAARKVNDLPILNVDEQLIEYGQTVASLWRDAASGSRGASIEAGVDRAGQPSVYRYRSYYGVGGVNAPNYATRQSDQQARATTQQLHLSALKQIDQMTAEVRVAMTKKYHLEF